MNADATEPDKPSERECQDAQLIHLLQLCWLVLPGVGGLLVPLLVWVMRQQSSAFLDESGREVVNLQISMLLYWAVAGILAFPLFCLGIVGWIMMGVLLLMQIILPIVGGQEARRGEVYRYPVNIRFLS